MTFSESRNPRLPPLMWVIIDTKGISQEDLQKPISPEQREFLKSRGWVSSISDILEKTRGALNVTIQKGYTSVELLPEMEPLDADWRHPNISTMHYYTGLQALLITEQYPEYFNDDQPAAYQEPSRWHISDRVSEFNKKGGTWAGIENSRLGRFIARIFSGVMGGKSKDRTKPRGYDL